MSNMLIGIADFFGAFNKIRKWLKGKKTIISAIIGILGSAGAILTLFISWIDGKINTQQFIDQATLPATTFWASVTFLFAALHPRNVADNDIKKLGPGY